MSVSKFITPRSVNYSAWYNSIVKMAGLAEESPVRGCMIIKPYGYSIWQKLQSILDKTLQESGHHNAYFPLLVPKSFFSKEAQHVKGFAKECAIVTHYRLRSTSDKTLEVDPEAKLSEELIIRPTSETIIWKCYKNWIQSYRDLPVLINQWANVVRWEMRTRPFLRTSEFLWQEGHTAHKHKEEAMEETLKILDIYSDLLRNVMAIDHVKGKKTDSERFAGAEETYCVEALMQDGKALQAGTSHFLGQNFAKVFDVKYANEKGKLEYVWGTSWGVSTRLMGALIMVHSDDKGLVLPPKLAPIQVVLVPIYRSDEERSLVCHCIETIVQEFKANHISYKFDDRDEYKPGFKFSEWEMKGVPIRIAIGKRDVENQTVELYRRDIDKKETFPLENITQRVRDVLLLIQENMLNKSSIFLKENIHEVNNYDDFLAFMEKKSGFALSHWDGSAETEQIIKERTKATIRCIPFFEKEKGGGNCIFSHRPSKQRVLFAKSY